MYRERKKFSEVSVQRFFEKDGQVFLKITPSEFNGGARNAVSLDEKYVFVQDDAVVLVKKRVDK